MRVSGNAAEAVRWDAIGEVWTRFRKNYLTSPWGFMGIFASADNNSITLSKNFGAAKRESSLYYTRYSFDKYVLRRVDGSEVVIDKAFGNFKQLGQNLEQGITAFMLPRMLASYNAGQTLQFGAIGLNMQGMSLYGGQVAVAWPELLESKSAIGYLYIRYKKQGKMLTSLERIPINNVPNAFVMQALVKQIKGLR
jgi:hypothetical protein